MDIFITHILGITMHDNLALQKIDEEIRAAIAAHPDAEDWEPDSGDMPSSDALTAVLYGEKTHDAWLAKVAAALDCGPIPHLTIGYYHRDLTVGFTGDENTPTNDSFVVGIGMMVDDSPKFFQQIGHHLSYTEHAASFRAFLKSAKHYAWAESMG